MARVKRRKAKRELKAMTFRRMGMGGASRYRMGAIWWIVVKTRRRKGMIDRH